MLSVLPAAGTGPRSYSDACALRASSSCPSLVAACLSCRCLPALRDDARQGAAGEARRLLHHQRSASKRSASEAAPLVVVLARQVGEDPMKRESWQIADHFVLEDAGPWQFAASAGTYGDHRLPGSQRRSRRSAGEPYLRLERKPCSPARRASVLPTARCAFPAAGRSRIGETIDIATLQVRTFDQQFALSLSQVTAVGEIANLSDPRFDDAIANAGPVAAVRLPVQGASRRLLPRRLRAATRSRCCSCTASTARRRTSSTLIDRLDRSRFQPWVYYYPGGASLGNVADHLVADDAQAAGAVRLPGVRGRRAQHGWPGVARLHPALSRGRRRADSAFHLDRHAF